MSYRKKYFYGLPTGLEDIEPERITAWAYEFLPLLADRLFWGYQFSTREINRKFQKAFPGLLPDDIALSIIRGEIGGARHEKLVDNPF